MAPDRKSLEDIKSQAKEIGKVADERALDINSAEKAKKELRESRLAVDFVNLALESVQAVQVNKRIKVATKYKKALDDYERNFLTASSDEQIEAISTMQEDMQAFVTNLRNELKTEKVSEPIAAKAIQNIMGDVSSRFNRLAITGHKIAQKELNNRKNAVLSTAANKIAANPNSFGAVAGQAYKDLDLLGSAPLTRQERADATQDMVTAAARGYDAVDDTDSLKALLESNVAKTFIQDKEYARLLKRANRATTEEISDSKQVAQINTALKERNYAQLPTLLNSVAGPLSGLLKKTYATAAGAANLGRPITVDASNRLLAIAQQKHSPKDTKLVNDILDGLYDMSVDNPKEFAEVFGKTHTVGSKEYGGRFTTNQESVSFTRHFMEIAREGGKLSVLDSALKDKFGLVKWRVAKGELLANGAAELKRAGRINRHEAAVITLAADPTIGDFVGDDLNSYIKLAKEIGPNDLNFLPSNAVAFAERLPNSEPILRALQIKAMKATGVTSKQLADAKIKGSSGTGGDKIRDAVEDYITDLNKRYEKLGIDKIIKTTPFRFENGDSAKFDTTRFTAIDSEWPVKMNKIKKFFAIDNLSRYRNVFEDNVVAIFNEAEKEGRLNRLKLIVREQKPNGNMTLEIKDQGTGFSEPLILKGANRLFVLDLAAAISQDGVAIQLTERNKKEAREIGSRTGPTKDEVKEVFFGPFGE